SHRDTPTESLLLQGLNKPPCARLPNTNLADSRFPNLAVGTHFLDSLEASKEATILSRVREVVEMLLWTGQ
ncbi:MAG: hypothetical protein L0I76_19245, partial [Pseudonocardia sp.]|nr:hypothetical protein [Pseudonocardia sp.]